MSGNISFGSMSYLDKSNLRGYRRISQMHFVALRCKLEDMVPLHGFSVSLDSLVAPCFALV